MPLTTHQRFHLNTMKAEIADNKLQSDGVKLKLSLSKNISLSGYANYLDAVEAEVQKILDSGKFPAGLEPSDIHDYLEK